MMNKQQLMICDLDGTLFKTDDVNYYAYKVALQDYGYTLDKDYFISECLSKHYTEFLPNLVKEEHIEIVHKLKKGYYSKYLSKTVMNKHLFNIIELNKSNYYISIVTTASKQNTMDILKYHNVQGLFDYIVTQEDMTKTKPDPEGFFLAMRHFNVCAGDTVIYEDSEVGILAARSTGASVFVVDKF